MRHLTWLVPALGALMLIGCGSDGSTPDAGATVSTGTVTTAAAGNESYSAAARVLLSDLATAQRGLADAIAADAPLSDAWKQGVAARTATLATLEERAARLDAPADQRTAHAQLTLAIRRSREAADTVATAVAEGNLSMLERANALLSDAAYQTTAAVAVLPR